MRPRGSSLSFRRAAVAPSDPIRNDVGHRACEDLESQGACRHGRKMHRSRERSSNRSDAPECGGTIPDWTPAGSRDRFEGGSWPVERFPRHLARRRRLRPQPPLSPQPRWAKTAAAEAPGRGAGGSGGGGGSGGAGAARAREQPPVDRVRRLRRPGGRRRPASRPCRRLGAPAAADVRGACSTQVAARERKGPERSQK